MIDLLLFFPASGDGGGDGDGDGDGVRSVGVTVPGIAGIVDEAGNHFRRMALAIGAFVTVK